jgi:hypothetical protein
MSESRPRSFVWPVRIPGRAGGEPGQQLPERLRATRLRIGITFAFFLGINLLLIAAYIWSRGGQTTHVTIEANGDQFVAQIDGRLVDNARLPGPEQGGVVVLLGNTGSVPSLPQPRGLDSIRITDTITGKTLFEDDFTSGPSPDWTIGGTAFVRSGVLGSHGDLSLALLNRDWQDYVVDATFRNIQSGAIIVRAHSGATGVYYGFHSFRDNDNAFAILENNTSTQSSAGAPIELKRTETVKSLLAMVLQPYPHVFLLLAVAFIIVLGLQLLATFAPPAASSGLSESLALAAAAGLAVFGFALTLFLDYSYGSHMPHVPDELSYLFQAKLLASARLTAPLPRVQDAFDYFYPPLIVATHGHWTGSFPFGHPLLLSLGIKMGAVWLIPPIVGALSVLLTFAIGRKVYNARVGGLAALLFVASPFYLMTASNLMSHNTAAFYLLGSLACIAYAERRPVLFGVLGGLCFGLLFNTQPLAAVSLLAPFGLLLGSELLPANRRVAGKKVFASFVAGGLVMLAAYFLHNYGTTSDPFTTVLSETSSKLVGFGGANSASLGIQNQQTQMAFLLLVLNGWPIYIGLMFVLLPFLLATRRRWDWFLLISSVCAMGVYVLFGGSGIMHGPRYWYVASPLLMLLSARGAERAGEVLSDIASRVRHIVIPARPGPAWAGALTVYVFIAALAGTSAYNWLLDRNTTWSDPFVPANAGDLRGFNSVDDRLLTLIRAAHLHNALVLVQDDCNGWCYGSVFWQNNLTLDGDIVYARDLPDRRAELFAAYPNRFVYYAHYDSPTYLSVYGSSIPLAQSPAPITRRARDIALPSRVPTPSPDVTEASHRDDERRHDLGVIAQALQQYYGRHGAYPLATVLQTFCTYVGLDAGCSVKEVLDPLPRDPSEGRAYYYLSDGRWFYMFADTELPAGASQCAGAPSTPNLPPDHLYCVHGPPPASGGTPALTP